MKRAMAAAVVLLSASVLVLGSATAGDKKDDDKEKKNGKVHTVGKDGLKIEAKLVEDDKRHEYKVTLEGNDLELKLRMKSYQVKLEGGAKYKMTVDAGDDEFDPLLVVYDSASKMLAYDDDGGGNLNSKLEFTAKNAGTYTIHVAGMRDTLGPYTLKIVSAGKDEAK